MALANSINPKLQGVAFTAQSVTADDAPSSLNSIEAHRRSVKVTGVTNDANDFVVLPPIASVQAGHEINILCNAGSNFELRTPASSNTKINNVDSDGTQEYLCTDTDMVRVISNGTGWLAQSITVLGAVRTAVIPD